MYLALNSKKTLDLHNMFITCYGESPPSVSQISKPKRVLHCQDLSHPPVEIKDGTHHRIPISLLFFLHQNKKTYIDYTHIFYATPGCKHHRILWPRIEFTLYCLLILVLLLRAFQLDLAWKPKDNRIGVAGM